MRLKAALLAGAFLLAWSSPALARPADAAARCAALARQALPDTEIKSATYVAAGPYAGPGADAGGVTVALPAHCRVAGTIRPAPRSAIGFELWLPADWNGKFQGVGNGGFAGDIGYRGGLVEAVARGYAAASTDTGHVASNLTSGWAAGNVDAQIDYGHRGIHLTAVTAKALVRAFYGRSPRLSVFSSCSNGGRQALMEAQRYPADYDGIIAGAPAYDWTRLAQIFLWNGQSLTRTPESNLPLAKLPLVQAAILAQCDEIDGQKDGLIRDPRRCEFMASGLICQPGADPARCLTPDEAAAVDRIHQGPPSSRARRIGYSAAGVEAERGGWSPWILNPDPRMTAAGVFGLGIARDFANLSRASFADFDFLRDGPVLDAAMGPFLNATDPDLSAFFGRGGKLILYHGWGDAAVPPEMTLDYHDAVLARMGPAAARAMRLFMVPGMEHCNAGPGLNSFGQGAAPLPGADPAEDIGAAMEAWLLRGRVPEQLVGVSAKNWAAAPLDRRIAEVQRTGLICAWPKQPVWDRKGDPGKAASYACRTVD